MSGISDRFRRALHEDEETSGQMDASSDNEAPEGSSRVPLAVGQQVEVRTKRGDLVASGYISELNAETRVARVIDRGSGTDLQLDVSPEMYDIWLMDQEPTGQAPTSAKQPRLSVHSKLPGAYVGGRFKH